MSHTINVKKKERRKEKEKKIARKKFELNKTICL